MSYMPAPQPEYMLFSDEERCPETISLGPLRVRCGRWVGHGSTAPREGRASDYWHGTNIQYTDASGTHSALLEWALSTVNALPPESIA